ncbi:MAG: hypothetical protein Q8N51_16340 [Gammaproteobacteria bacterium]|nr:hypothetical protein [Gammaproteobacteria bacterium]
MTAYPHMMPADVPVWERWLAKHASEDNLFDYDILVGSNIDTPEDMPEPYGGMAIALSKKRIDVVITSDSGITVAEVKQLAGWTAIGQMFGYPLLFIDEFQPDIPVSGLLIAESLTKDTQRILDAFKIPYELV